MSLGTATAQHEDLTVGQQGLIACHTQRETEVTAGELWCPDVEAGLCPYAWPLRASSAAQAAGREGSPRRPQLRAWAPALTSKRSVPGWGRAWGTIPFSDLGSRHTPTP